MRQFDVCRNPSARSRAGIPYVVVLQSHFFEGVPTVIVGPLIIDDGRSAYSEASVRIEFQGVNYVLSIPELAGIDRSALGPAIGDVRSLEDQVRRALDRLFTGF